jgi:hypothetical protein
MRLDRILAMDSVGGISLQWLRPAQEICVLWKQICRPWWMKEVLQITGNYLDIMCLHFRYYVFTSANPNDSLLVIKLFFTEQRSSSTITMY